MESEGMKKLPIVALLLGVIALPAIAAPPGPDSAAPRKKEAWEWSDSERLAVRLDPAFVRANSRPTSAAGPLQVDSVDESTPVQFTLSGKTHPELFMPFELFVAMMN